MPHHPAVTKVIFETTAAQGNAEPAAKFAASLMARTVGHLEHVDVGAIVGAYLEVVDSDLDPDSLSSDPEYLGAEMLRITSLVETVLDEAQSVLRNRVMADFATTLIPRLKGTRSL